LSLHASTGPKSSPAAKALKGLALALLLPLLAACSSLLGGNAAPSAPPRVIVQAPPLTTQPPPAQRAFSRDPAQFYTPKGMEGRALIRVALLLPYNSSNPDIRDLSASLYNAAQLALFEFNNRDIVLMPKATGSAQAAKQAAVDAITQGADMILGPLFAEEVSAITPIARASHVPVVAFSSDVTVAQPGVYLLSFPPDEEVKRIVDFAVLNGMTKFAALTPQSDYGNRVAADFRQSVADHGSSITDMVSYPADVAGMNDPVMRVAHYGARHAALVARRKALEAAGDTAGAKALEKVDTQGDLPYQAIFVPEGGTRLKALAPLLPYYDVDPRKIKFIGTGLWDDPTLAREPSLDGGWFASPPPEAHQQFVARYIHAYHDTPPRIASLAYDGVSLAVALAAHPGDGRFSDEALTHPDGFAGVDGIFRFTPEGRIERGLAVLAIHPGGAAVVDPAPQSFGIAPTN